MNTEKRIGYVSMSKNNLKYQRTRDQYIVNDISQSASSLAHFPEEWGPRKVPWLLHDSAKYLWRKVRQPPFRSSAETWGTWELVEWRHLGLLGYDWLIGCLQLN